MVKKYSIKVERVVVTDTIVDLTINQYVGEKIKQYRKRLKINQEQLGKEVCIVRTSICNIEAGKQGINIEMIERFCTFFKCSSSDLLPF